MEFADQAAYASYNDHPDHVAFVRDRWIPEVETFLEIDYVPLIGNSVVQPSIASRGTRCAG